MSDASHSILRAVQQGFVEIRQVALLLAVTREPGLSVRDYAPRLGVTRPIVSRASDVLSQSGLITDSRPQQDKRLRVLRPTPRGRTVIELIVGREVARDDQEPDSQAAVNRAGDHRR